MPRRDASPRNLAFARRLKTDYGLDVSESQLERWRGWRGVGLIPRRPPGARTRWAPGLADSIPEDEVRWVAEAAELVGAGARLDDVGWELARRGWPIDAKALRAVIVDRADELLGLLEDVDERAEAVHRAGRRHHRGRSEVGEEHVREVADALADPSRIRRAMSRVWNAAASEILEAVRQSRTPLDALDLLDRSAAIAARLSNATGKTIEPRISPLPASVVRVIPVAIAGRAGDA
jgi:hypothetical protein